LGGGEDCLHSAKILHTYYGSPFSRHLRGILPSSLQKGYSITFSILYLPPVSVLVRARASSLEDFCLMMASGTRRLSARWLAPQVLLSRFDKDHPYMLPQDNHHLVPLSLLVPPSVQRKRRVRNINLWPSTIRTPFGSAIA